MKKFACLLIIFGGLLLAGCMTPMAEQLMPAIKYNKSINVHSNKTAYLTWRTGRTYASGASNYIPASQGVLGAMVISSIDQYQRKHNPGRYRLIYGKARQAVFMTSLKNILLQHGVFKHVILTTSNHRLRPGQLNITVNFVETRVGRAQDAYPITLNTKLAVAAPGITTYRQHYLVQSNKSYSLFSSPSFKDQQIMASKNLMNRIVAGISTWVRRHG